MIFIFIGIVLGGIIGDKKDFNKIFEL